MTTSQKEKMGLVSLLILSTAMVVSARMALGDSDGEASMKDDDVKDAPAGMQSIGSFQTPVAHLL